MNRELAYFIGGGLLTPCEHYIYIYTYIYIYIYIYIYVPHPHHTTGGEGDSTMHDP